MLHFHPAIMYRFCPLVGAGCRLEPNPATPAREAAYTVDKSPADRRTATVYVIFCHESNMKEPVGEELREAGKSVKSRSIEEGGGGGGRGVIDIT